MFKMGEEAMAATGAQRLSVKHYSFDWRERNAHNDIAVRKRPCLPFGVHAGGRLGKYLFHQTGDLAEYAKMVEGGRKPIAYAGLPPDDFEVCAEIAGQIGRRMSVNIEKAADLDPARARDIVRTCEPLLLEWLDKGLLTRGRHGWLRFSSKALFKHSSFAERLMNAVAEAYEEGRR
jgi:coproporphyrinogen III oxidase-like Fe-S oxidoreductase